MNRTLRLLFVCLLQAVWAVASAYNLKVEATPHGACSLNTSGGDYDEGSSVYLRTYGNTGYVFKGWYKGEEVISSSASFYYTMPAEDVVLQARFDYDPSVPANPNSMATNYTVLVKCKPVGGGSFNTSSTTAPEGSSVRLYSYTNTGYIFKHWEDSEGKVLSTAQNFYYTIPHGNSVVYGVFEYDPPVPSNPGKNYWNKELGEVIVDDFSAGYLGNAVSSVIGGSSRDEVAMITVAGKMNDNDFGIANNFTNCTLLDLSRVTGITTVPSYAFDYTNLESVYLPASIETIGYKAFYECKQLSSLTVYAMVPPAVEDYAFSGIPEGLVVYVPAASISQYQEAEGWKNFTLLPIQEDIRNVTISLPEGTDASVYAQMWLELTNRKSGQRMHFVMTDRSSYTFANIIRNTSWNAVIRNQRGDVFGKIDAIDVADEDVTVAFESLQQPQNVTLTVKDAEGKDVTADTQITWTDAAGNYLAQSYSINGLLPGNKLGYNIVLSQNLAMAYAAPSLTEYTVAESDNNIVCTLSPLQKVVVSGKVIDLTTKSAISGAVVSASQTFGGKYSKTTNVKTDSKGQYSIEVFRVPTSLAIAASDYVSQTMDCDVVNADGENISIDDVSLKSISGAVISLGFTYTKSPDNEGEEGTVESFYSDYNNVDYAIFNKTQNRSISQFNVQYPNIVLLEEVSENDVLELTASSRTSAFVPVKTKATIDAEQRASATFNIVGLGKLRSTFEVNSNSSVVGSLYDSKGKLIKTYDYSGGKLIVSDLADGNYSLVTMGSSRLFNTIYDLNQLPQTGLTKDVDYVQNNVKVESGKLSVISIAEVPTLDESKLYYTGDNTSFTVNKTSIVAGNYLTLTGHLDFKSAYSTKVSNVNLIVDLPESCSFVENSVMVGNSTSSYTLNGNRLTIPMVRYTDRVRFCIIPTLGGQYAPSALAQFDIEGKTITQPIGSANYTAEDLSIKVPSVVAKTTIPVSGTAIGVSDIEIYDNGVLIGQTQSLANGTWATTCELNEPYNLSSHKIYAKIVTKKGIELVSNNEYCVYDVNAIQVSVVKMYHDNPELHKTFELTFDFLNPSTKEENYIYYIYNKKFTFTIDFTNNDTTKVSNVVLYVKTAKSGWHSLNATYNEKQKLWVASGEFGNMYDGDLPINVSVDFLSLSDPLASSAKLKDMREDASDGYDDYVNGKNSIRKAISDVFNNVNQAGDDMEKLKEAYDMVEKTIISINEQYSLGMDLEPSSEYYNLSETALEATEQQDSIRIQKLLEEVKLEMEEFNSIFVYKEFFDYFDEISGSAIKSTTCEGLLVENLLADGYEIVLTDAGDSLYAKICNDTISYVNYKDNICQTIVLEKLEESFAQMAKIRRIISKDDLNDISEQMLQLLAEIKKAKRKVDILLAALGRVSVATIQNDYSEMLSSSKELASALTNLGGLVSEFVEKTQTKIFAPIRSLQDKYNKLHSEWSLAKAHASRSKGNKHLFWKSFAARLEEQMAPIKFILNQKWVVNVGKFIGKYAPVANIVFTVASAVEKIGIVIGTASTIFPCKDDMWHACLAMVDAIEIIRNIGNYVGVSLGVEAALDASAIATSETIIGAIVCVGIKFIASWGVDKITGWHFENRIKMLEQKIVNLKCYQPCKNGLCPDNGNEGGSHHSNNPDKKFGIDPSGYVYEGVFSNRLEGVTATCYYKETVEDMYGDKHENIVKWDASEYAQENPLFTDENGYYRWDVPQGLWQVKFEKEGYETTYSEWLPVPPPQLDINIAMKQNVQPTVKSARAFEDAVEMEFDKYMMPELLTTDNIRVMTGETAVEGTVELLNEEVSYEGNDEKFASKVRFNAAAPFDATEITLMVSNRVKSYAGIRMQDDFSQKFTIEPEIREIVCDSVTSIVYGNTDELTVQVLPAVASAGKTLKVKSSSAMILTTDVEEVTLDEEGKAKLIVSGELPGASAITYTIDGYDLTATTIVNVNTLDMKTCEMPTANVASGSIVHIGTPIKLSCATEGATIYYTLDGSCPCNETEARKVYDGTPIIANGDVTIKAMAVASDMYESDVAEFTYKSSGLFYADMNRDGVVNVTDVVSLINYISTNDASNIDLKWVDMNEDGTVNVTDVVYLINYLSIK